MPSHHISLEGKNLSCERGYRCLFDRLYFSLQAGDALHISGNNGCGKTSLLRIIAGLADPLMGDVLYQGQSCLTQREAYMSQLAWMGHKAGIKLALTAQENIDSYLSLRSQRVTEKKITETLYHVGLYGFEEVFAYQLSAGQKRRIALAQIVLSQAKIWIMDEPFIALDNDGVAFLIACMAQHQERGGLVLFTTHQAISLSGMKTLHIPDFAVLEA